MNGVSGRAGGNSNAGTTRYSGNDGFQGRLQPDQGSLVQRLEASIRLFDSLLEQNRTLRQEMAALSEALTRASRFACHDELTGLPNRRLLQDRFDQAVARATRQHRQVVLLFLDLNGFKAINDSVGHLAADRLLQQVGGRLTSCIRRSDTACRFGGDEFVVLLTDIESRNQAIAVINKVIVELSAPYHLDSTPVSMTASLGVATFPADGQNYHELLHVADVTMYRNKVSRRTELPRVPEAA